MLKEKKTRRGHRGKGGLKAWVPPVVEQQPQPLGPDNLSALWDEQAPDDLYKEFLARVNPQPIEAMDDHLVSEEKLQPTKSHTIDPRYKQIFNAHQLKYIFGRELLEEINGINSLEEFLQGMKLMVPRIIYKDLTLYDLSKEFLTEEWKSCEDSQQFVESVKRVVESIIENYGQNSVLVINKLIDEFLLNESFFDQQQIAKNLDYIFLQSAESIVGSISLKDMSERSVSLMRSYLATTSLDRVNSLCAYNNSLDVLAPDYFDKTYVSPLAQKILQQPQNAYKIVAKSAKFMLHLSNNSLQQHSVGKFVNEILLNEKDSEFYYPILFQEFPQLLAFVDDRVNLDEVVTYVRRHIDENDLEPLENCREFGSDALLTGEVADLCKEYLDFLEKKPSKPTVSVKPDVATIHEQPEERSSPGAVEGVRAVGKLTGSTNLVANK